MQNRRRRSFAAFARLSVTTGTCKQRWPAGKSTQLLDEHVSVGRSTKRPKESQRTGDAICRNLLLCVSLLMSFSVRVSRHAMSGVAVAQRSGAAAASSCTNVRVGRRISLQRPIGQSNICTSSINAAPILKSPLLLSLQAGPSSHLHSHQTQQQRLFAGGYKRKGGGKGKQDGPLRNEHLVRFLLKSKKASSADSVQVRLVVDKGAGSPPETDVATLQSAIDTSNDLGLDLMEISVKQDIPVIKAVDYSRLLFEKSKQSKSSGFGKQKGGKKGKGGGGGGLAVKEFKFKAGIADNDLERKAENMIKYLVKGHRCQVTIIASRFRLREDAAASATTLERVREILGEYVMEPKNKKGNEAGTYTTMQFEPNPKKVVKE